MLQSNQSKIFKNAAILFLAMLISKLVGAALKIPLTNILGGIGMGYFSTAFSVFSPVYAVTPAALPTVIMRLTAQNVAAGRFRDVRLIRKAGLIAAFGLGLAGSAAILAAAKPFSQYIAASPNALPAMLVIAPSLFFCSIAAVYRGYYEGLSNMLPTALSQIIEAIIKSSTGILLALMFMPAGVHYAAAAAIAGITIAEFFGLIFLFARTRLMSDGISPAELQRAPVPQRKRVIIRTLLHESLPITLAALAMNLNPFIDMLTIPSIITRVYGGDMGNFAFGSYTGITIPIFALATSITAMVCKSALPEITAAYGQKNTARLLKALRILFKGTFMVGLPICTGLAALARPILSLLYFSRPAEVAISAPPLTALGLGGVSVLLAGTLFGIFLSAGRTDLQIKLMLIGAAIKLGGNLTLVRIPQLGVTGAAISTIAAYTFISVAGLILLKRLIREDIGITRFIAQPLVFAALCGITARICYYNVFTDRSDLLRLAMSVAAGALVYLVLTMFTDRKYIKSFLPARNT
jgi:stage V sporulation protein B